MRVYFLTLLVLAKPDGIASCISGNDCIVTGVSVPTEGYITALSYRTNCQTCKCAGISDSLSRGSVCTLNAQEPALNELQDDPNGPWCYVASEACADGSLSEFYPALSVSYSACQEIQPFLSGFSPAAALDTTPISFKFESPVTAFGGQYDLCFCASECALVTSYSLLVGSLHVRGPSEDFSLEPVYVCVAGRNCSISLISSSVQDVQISDRLLALPGPCASWEPPTPADPVGVPGFPSLGITDTPAPWPFLKFSWGGSILAAGGVYNLCWCGSACDSRILGNNYLGEVGRVQVQGPALGGAWICGFGGFCEISKIQGVGLRGEDRIVVVESGDCGRSISIKSPSQLSPNSSSWFSYLSGIEGFPGISAPSGRRGTYGWTERIFSPLGTFSVCWCSRVAVCADSTDFELEIGTMTVSGAARIGSKVQLVSCVVYEDCIVNGFFGDFDKSDFFAIVAVESSLHSACVSAASVLVKSGPLSFVNQFVSFTLPAVTLAGGRYALCWCRGDCEAGNFNFFAAAVDVRAPAPNQAFTCNPGEVCVVGPVGGVGGTDFDALIVAPNCGGTGGVVGFGVSSKVYGNGTFFEFSGPEGKGVTAPVATYRLCWGGGVGEKFPSFFNFDIGSITLRGPLANQNAVCYDRRICKIGILDGIGISVNDVIFLTAIGEDCSSGPVDVDWFPQKGVSDPFSDFFNFGTSEISVQSPPVYLQICWVNGSLLNLTNTNESIPYPITLPAGILSIRAYKDWWLSTGASLSEPSNSEIFILSFFIPTILALSLLARCLTTEDGH